MDRFMRFLIIVMRDFTTMVNIAATPILSPPIRWINRVTGASSRAMVPWFFGIAFVCDMIGDVLGDAVNPLNVSLGVIGHGYWCYLCQKVARELAEWDGSGVIPNPYGIVSICVMRAVDFVLGVLWLGTLPFDYSTGDMIDWIGNVLFLLGLSASIDYHGGRKSLVRKAIEKVGEALRSLIPQPTPVPVPAFVGGR